MKTIKKVAISLVLALLIASAILPMAVATTDDDRNWDLFHFNYRFSSGPDYRQVLGTPTITDIVPSNPATDNVRRNAGAAFNPPPPHVHSGAIATERNNIFAIQSPVHNVTVATIASDFGMLPPTTVSGVAANVTTAPGGSNVSVIPPPNISSTLPSAPRITEPSFFADGSMGRLTIPAISLQNARIFHGVTYSVIDNHIGHFPSTSAWDGNVGLAAHNGGRAGYFQRINQLRVGDEIRLETPNGVRVYHVASTHTIHETDFELLRWSSDNRIVLITCIAGGRRDMRFAVVAVEAT